MSSDERKKAEKAEKQRQYSKDNREKENGRLQLWRKKNPEKRAEQTQRYREKNREILAAKQREYRKRKKAEAMLKEKLRGEDS